MDEEVKVSVAIPFPSKRAAKIAYDVLRIDTEPKRNHVTKTLHLDENILRVFYHRNFVGGIAKNVRVGLTNFYECLILCCETQQNFGPVAEIYEHF